MPSPTIAFLTYDWTFGVKPLQPNGCGWYRCYLPMKQLKEHGWETGIGLPGFNPDHGFGILIPDQKAIHGWDIVVLKLIMVERAVEQVRIARSIGQKIVVDIDDHMEGLEETNLAYKTTHPDANPNNNRDHYIAIMEQADALITSTPFLYDFYKNKYPEKPIYLVRNGIDIERWGIKRKDHSGRLPIFGWVGATPWRSGDLEIMSPFLGDWLNTRKANFIHSGHTKNGAPTAASQLNINENAVKTYPLVPIYEYPHLFSKIDVGIVPLNDIPFNHAKSYIKGLEYAASGIPFIASYSPEYQELADLGIGRIAKTQEDWVYHLDELRLPGIRKDEIIHNSSLLHNFSMEERGKDWNDTMNYILENV
jgi:glycosyltransferase involved in cell wall biosynthesis